MEACRWFSAGSGPPGVALTLREAHGSPGMQVLDRVLAAGSPWPRTLARSVASRAARAEIVLRLALLAAAFGVAYRGQVMVENARDLSGGLVYFCLAAVLV